eukprot:872246-Rhodomonas_salina.2
MVLHRRENAPSRVDRVRDKSEQLRFDARARNAVISAPGVRCICSMECSMSGRGMVHGMRYVCARSALYLFHGMQDVCVRNAFDRYRECVFSAFGL